MPRGWKRLVAGSPWFRGAGAYPIAAYSEFMPPPRFGPTPYGATDPSPFDEADDFGWIVSEHEEALSLCPGLTSIAAQIHTALVRLGRGQSSHGISARKLDGNPYWPPSLSERAGKLRHERYVLILPLSLSRSQDDKGRVRWTLFGGSEQGPSRAFWRSFYTAPGREVLVDRSLSFVRSLLGSAYGVPAAKLADLHAAGFRVFPDSWDEPIVPAWRVDHLPAWTEPYLRRSGRGARNVRYLLTFTPFDALPDSVRQAYLAGDLHLIPFPGSLVFWGALGFLQLRAELPLAMQIPLLHSVARHLGYRGIRVPQSGWMHEPRPDNPTPNPAHGPLHNHYKRTHRNARMHRDEPDDLAVLATEDKIAHVLFSPAEEDVGLYDKPMARNAQLWTDEFRLLLDGPHASGSEIERAAALVQAGGLFGYRFLFPAMRVGQHEVYWQRPLVAFSHPQTHEPTLLPDPPLGYMTAYRADHADVCHPVELWPRLVAREADTAAWEIFDAADDPRPHQTTLNVGKLFEVHRAMGQRPVPRSFARSLLAAPREQTLDDWLESLPGRSNDPARASAMLASLRGVIEPPAATARRQTASKPPASLTFERTARRAFEVAYWKTISNLSEGRFPNRNNADTARDAATQATVAHPGRDLDPLGEYILSHYRRVIRAAGLTGRALAGDLPFRWRTDFAFEWSNGWLHNQPATPAERDLIVVIPGRDRRRAVILADHYDTAYMADHFEKQAGGNGSRLAAAGADDNSSATATLMLGAPVFLELSRAGRLGCDVWLIHLTGEEFPADCLGARHLAQQLVEGSLAMRLHSGRRHDLSGVRVGGVFVLDMVAHNNLRNHDVFQISPGMSRESIALALQAHMANEAWNELAPIWNRVPSRRGRGRSPRRPDGSVVPTIAPHPILRGEVRLRFDPRSTLYNTDGQIFSDAGIPVVLFMEDYDIARTGYHDSQDTMANIDLDYGAGVAAIAIESVARATNMGNRRPTPARPIKRRSPR